MANLSNARIGSIGKVFAVVGRVCLAGTLMGAAMGLARGWQAAPILVAIGLLLSFGPLAVAWSKTKGTALRPALIWAGIALFLGLVAEWVAYNEGPENGRPLANQWIYLSVLSALAALMSILNARTPGSGAWALLMAMLVVVFLLPWLEGSWMVRQRDGWDRLRLAVPWNYFLLLLILTGVSNYLTTRYGLAAFVALIGFVTAWRALNFSAWDNLSRGSQFAWTPWCWAASVLMADLAGSRRSQAGAMPVNTLWLWFRDTWGSVWALRTRDRFNATAKAVGWTCRLEWNGVVSVEAAGGELIVPDEAVATLASLLRRFADQAKIDEAIEAAVGPDLADRSERGDH